MTKTEQLHRMRLLAGIGCMIVGIVSMFVGRNPILVGSLIGLSSVWLVLTFRIASRTIDSMTKEDKR